jgi:hypothetical protein
VDFTGYEHVVVVGSGEGRAASMHISPLGKGSNVVGGVQQAALHLWWTRDVDDEVLRRAVEVKEW